MKNRITCLTCFPQATTHLGIIAATDPRLPNPSPAHMNL